jgi:hypothetical protein
VSRPKSSRAASKKPAGRAAASRPAGGVFVQKPRSDIYVVLLGVSLGAMLIGCLLLLLKMNQYNWETKASMVTPPAGPALLAASDNFSTVRL